MTATKRNKTMKLSFRVPDITIKGPEDIEPQFNRLVSLVHVNNLFMEQAKKYNDLCIKKYDKIMSQMLDSTLRSLRDGGIDCLVQSSYSASVYVDNPGDVDLDIVALYTDDIDRDHGFTVAESLGFTFLEVRNKDMEHMIHYVYIKDCDTFIIELKFRQNDLYKEHLYKIHIYLDSLSGVTRMIWRYIRACTLLRDDTIKKRVKYLWYLYGAIKTNVRVDKAYMPMNVYY